MYFIDFVGVLHLIHVANILGTKNFWFDYLILPSERAPNLHPRAKTNFHFPCIRCIQGTTCIQWIQWIQCIPGTTRDDMYSICMHVAIRWYHSLKLTQSSSCTEGILLLCLIRLRIPLRGCLWYKCCTNWQSISCWRRGCVHVEWIREGLHRVTWTISWCHDELGK